MAYKKEDLIKKSLAAIKKHKLIFMQEVASYLPCSRRTFYDQELHKLHTIEEALENNKISTKSKLRKKWETGNNPALNLALYRLCSTDEEKEKIAPTTNHKIGGDSKNPVQINVGFNSTGVPPITSEDDI
jgi:hypothetical protein